MAASRVDTLRSSGRGSISRVAVLLTAFALVATACGGGTGTPGPGSSTSTGASSAPGTSAAPAETGPAGVEAPATKVALDFWTPFTGADGDTMVTLVDQFNSETPNVQIAVQRLPEYYTKVNTALGTPDAPEIMIMHIDALARYAAEDKVQPLTDLSTKLGLTEAEFTPAVWAGTMWKGTQFSIPLDVHPQVLYFNRALLTASGATAIPPTNKAEFEDGLQKCKDAGHDQGFMSNHAYSAGLTWVSLFYQLGGEWTNADYTEATFNSEAGVQAAQYLRGLIESGLQPQQVDPDAELSNLEAGAGCFATTGIWQTTRLQASLGEDFGVAPFPQIFDGSGSWAGSHTLAIRKDVTGDEQMGAYYFLNWLTSNTVAWAAGGQLPARTSVRESAEFGALADIPDIAPAMDGVRFPPPIPGSGDLFFGPGGVNEKLMEYLTNGGDPKPGLDAAAQQYTEILKEAKTKFGF